MVSLHRTLETPKRRKDWEEKEVDEVRSHHRDRFGDHSKGPPLQYIRSECERENHYCKTSQKIHTSLNGIRITF